MNGEWGGGAFAAAGFEAPLVSVVMAVRDSGAALEKALDSLAGQTYPCRELIVIDGGSSDGTVELLRRRQAEIAYWSSEPDAGIYDALNKGIAAARGEWLYFLGADDAFFSPETLSRVMEKAAGRPEIDLVVGRVLLADGRLFAGRFDGRLLLKNSIHHQGAFYRRRLFDSFRYGGGQGRGGFLISGDYELNLLLYLKGARALLLPETIARCGPGLSMEGRFRGYREEMAIRHRHVNTFAALPLDVLTLLRFAAKRILLNLAPRGGRPWR